MSSTNLINDFDDQCGVTGGEIDGYPGCRSFDVDTNMLGNTSFCIPCYELYEAAYYAEYPMCGFCEVCDEHKKDTVWFKDSFKHPLRDSNIYSLCGDCKKRYTLICSSYDPQFPGHWDNRSPNCEKITFASHQPSTWEQGFYAYCRECQKHFN